LESLVRRPNWTTPTPPPFLGQNTRAPLLVLKLSVVAATDAEKLISLAPGMIRNLFATSDLPSATAPEASSDPKS
jgi:hypothetical protein